MKKAIVTGATGVIGTALVRELICNEVETLVLCREGSKRNANLPDHPLIRKLNCSLEQLSSIQNPENSPYDIFYHFAWAGTTGSSRNDLYLQNLNVRYALDAVEAAKRFGCKRFIGAGSQAEYGRVSGKLSPETPVHPETGYGCAKLCAGEMTRIFAQQCDIEHVWVRVLSVYGPNDGSQSLIMMSISELQGGGRPKFTKGEQVWDYLYSEDAARAFYLLGDFGVNGKTYVLGSGTAKPLFEYICKIRDIVSPETEIRFGEIPYGKDQVMHLEADIDNLREDINWEPRIDFETGIKNILLWKRL